MATPEEILDVVFESVSKNINSNYVSNMERRSQIRYVCRCLSNRGVVRALMACLLVKLHRPEVDIRKPYTAIGDTDSYGGRSYDEKYISPFVAKHKLPCNRTTGFLSPALRNHEDTLYRNASLVGRPRELYENFLALLDDVAQERETPQALLDEVVRQLLLLRNEQDMRLSSQLSSLKISDPSLLSVESIVNIIQNHLSQRYSSRLPVLAIFAIYKTIESKLNERIVPLEAHNAADSQTDSLGDIEIAIWETDQVITVFEMKTREITFDDFSQALQKLAASQNQVRQYLFVVTQPISQDIKKHIRELNESGAGVEFAALDCIEFVRYFLHLFYQARISFLDIYQELVLAEPDSAVRFALKEVLLSLRQAAETVE